MKLTHKNYKKIAFHFDAMTWAYLCALLGVEEPFLLKDKIRLLKSIRTDFVVGLYKDNNN